MAKRAVSSNAFYVYILFRHDTGQPFYVGKGHGDRWTRHEKERARDTNRHKRAVINLAQKAGAEIPKVKIASNLTEAQAFEVERAFIAAIGRQHVGGPLTNLTDGGDGESGRIISDNQKETLRGPRKGKKLSVEEREKIKIAMARPEVVARMSAISKKRFESAEERRRAGLANIGRKRSAETQAKQLLNNKGNLGHKHSEEAREKIRAARAKQAPFSADTIAKMSAASASRRHSLEARMKIKAAWVRRKAAMIEQQSIA